MGRKNRRKKTEYRDRLGFNPKKYINRAPYTSGKHYASGKSVSRKPYARPSEDGENRMPYRTPHRGEIWFAELGYHPGTSVQDGCRPVLIISNDKGNHSARTVVALPMTSRLKKSDMPTHVEVSQADLTRTDENRPLGESMILAEQITTIDKSALRNYVGKVETADKMAEIDKAVKTQLGMAV